MSRHRTLAEVRRGVAKWPIAILGVIVLLLLGWLGLNWVNGALDRRASAQSHACPEGESVLRVAVAPSAAGAVMDAAKRWNEQNTVVYDHCVQVDVAGLETKQVFA